MTTKNKKTSKKVTDKKVAQKEPEKVSKTWLAFQKHIGTGKILDMRAVLK